MLGRLAVDDEIEYVDRSRWKSKGGWQHVHESLPNDAGVDIIIIVIQQTMHLGN
jgi:hypothetical protein